MTTREEVIKAAKSAKLSRFMFDTDRCKDDLERFYTIAYKAGMERAAKLCDDTKDNHCLQAAHTNDKKVRRFRDAEACGAEDCAEAIREEAKK